MSPLEPLSNSDKSKYKRYRHGGRGKKNNVICRPLSSLKTSLSARKPPLTDYGQPSGYKINIQKT